MFHPVPRELLYFAYKIQLRFVRHDASTFECAGTCFFLGDGTNAFLITNRHVIDPGYSGVTKNSTAKIERMVISGFAEEEYFEIAIVPTFSPIYSNNTFEDVAVIKTPQFYDLSDFKKIGSLSIDQLACEADFDGLIISLADQLSFPGYPEWHDHSESRPILRMGTVSSDPQRNYCSMDQQPARRMAYEAFSSGGSSGSPVFANIKGLKGFEFPTHPVSNYRTMKLVGINAGHLTADPNGFRQHSGISYLYKSTVIRELMGLPL